MLSGNLNSFNKNCVSALYYPYSNGKNIHWISFDNNLDI